MPHIEFKPRTAAREQKRQATEAVGRSFCKTLAELITNSDTSAKQKHGIAHASGLVEVMFSVPKGTQIETAALRRQLKGKFPQRLIHVNLVTTKSEGRPVGEVVVVDYGTGMSAAVLRTALEDIAGDRDEVTGGRARRGIFGRGLYDVMGAHSEPIVQTYDGNQLTIARGEWRKDGWIIAMDDFEKPGKSRLTETFLDPSTTGTAVRVIIKDRKRCHIPDPANIAYRLANFYMLRLIASDPNVELILRQHRAVGESEDRIEYDFPVGQVVESFSRDFDPCDLGFGDQKLKVDFLVVRADSERPLRGPAGVDRDARENGMLIVDDLDAVYDLTFADLDYERAEFLSRIYGIVRVNGLRAVCDRCLNDPETPTSPLRTDRDGFNRDHDFSRALLDFIADTLRDVYDKERKRAAEKEGPELSAETKKRIDDALKHLNKYFHEVTELSGPGTGPGPDGPKEPTEAVVFYPQQTTLIAGRTRQVLLLVRDDVVKNDAEVVATASEGFTVHPETERIRAKQCRRWPPHEQFFALRFSVSSTEVGRDGTVDAVIEGKEADLEATLTITKVLTEPQIQVPEALEFRPAEATGQPGRRNNLVLYVNPEVIPAGHYVRIEITKSVGDVKLINDEGARVSRVDLKLDKTKHAVSGQNVLRVLVPWRGTSWNQHARVLATVKVGGPKPLMAAATIRLDEPDEGGFFKDVQYDDLGEETLAPSMFAAGIITVNARDPLNELLFGNGKSSDELKHTFDQQLRQSGVAQARLAQLLVEEASFRALEHLRLNNELLLAAGREVTNVHEAINKYKYESAHAVHRALVRSTS